MVFGWNGGGHFVGETYYHFSYGQSVPGLMLDYIAVSLLLWARGWHGADGGGRLVRTPEVEFCLTYRALLWRMEQVWEGRQRS